MCKGYVIVLEKSHDIVSLQSIIDNSVSVCISVRIHLIVNIHGENLPITCSTVVLRMWHVHVGECCLLIPIDCIYAFNRSSSMPL